MTQPKDDFVNGVVFTKRIVEPSPDLLTDGANAKGIFTARWEDRP